MKAKKAKVKYLKLSTQLANTFRMAIQIELRAGPSRCHEWGILDFRKLKSRLACNHTEFLIFL